jgi:hypothetical protein
MSRFLKAAAAQMGPNPEGTPRDVVVKRMLALLEEAIVEDVESWSSSTLRPHGRLTRAATTLRELA